jgi:hypothetical protein
LDDLSDISRDSDRQAGRRRRRAQLLAGALAVSVGCAAKGDGGEISQVRSAITAPPISQFFVLARHGGSFGDRTVESGGGIGVGASGGASANTFSVGVDARVATTSVLIAPHVVLGARTTAGNVDADKIDAAQATTGTRSQFVAPPIAPAPGPTTPGSNAIAVASGQTVTLVAGRYGAVSVSGILKLAGGTYQIASLHLDNDAQLIAQMSAVIKVAGGVTALDRAHFLPVSGLGAGDLRIEVAGSADTTGDGVKLGNDARSPPSWWHRRPSGRAIGWLRPGPSRRRT